MAELKREKLNEQGDVDRLQNRSLTAFFYRITGKMGEKLTKEQAEAYAAAVKYDAAEDELHAVNRDVEHCQKVLNRLLWCEQEYQKVFDAKLAQIKASGSTQGQRILELERQSGILRGQKKEVDEAIRGRRQSSVHCRNDHGRSEQRKKLEHCRPDRRRVFVADIAKYDKLDNVQANVKSPSKTH